MSRRPDHDWVLPKDSPLPLYQQIQDLILGQIQAGKINVGDCLPSYPWLSKTLKVADKTVRQATLALQQAGVLSIQRGKGTFVLRGLGSTGSPTALGPGSGISGLNQLSPSILSSGISEPPAPTRLGVVGVIPPNLPVELPDEQLLWACLRGIQEACFERHIDTHLLTRVGDLRAQGAAEGLSMPRKIDGILCLAPAPEAFFTRLSVLGLPVVAVGACSGVPFDSQPGFTTFQSPTPSGSNIQPGFNSVSFDFLGAARELTYRLIGKGHKAIAFLSHPRGPGASALDEGYRHAMGAAGLPIRPEWVVRVDTLIGESGRAAAEHLLSLEITAVLSTDASLAKVLATSALAKGRAIPEMLAIASILDTWKPELPGGLLLDGLFMDGKELGRRALQRLDELISGEDPLPRREMLEALRVEGSSV